MPRPAISASISRRALMRAVALSGALPLFACSEVKAAPRAIKWGRDLCEFCHMPISDRRFASQVWDRQHSRARLYDDFGCAVLSAAEHGLIDDASLPFWTANEQKPDEWLDARSALYHDRAATPMNYGHAAGKAAQYTISFQTAAQTIRDKAACEHRS